jgi:hypothetical protein
MAALIASDTENNQQRGLRPNQSGQAQDTTIND